jgi:sulfonate transport system substrate-binding protein
LEERGVAKIVWSTKTLPPEAKDRTELWASAEFTEKYPELTQLVVTAYIKAAAWCAQPENREAVIQSVLRAGTNPETVVRRTYDDSVLWTQRWSPVFTPALHEHYREMAGFALDKKLIRNPIAGESLFDDRFTVQALKDLGLQDFWTQQPAVASAP